MPTYKELYEELQEGLSAAIEMLQQIQRDTNSAHVTENPIIENHEPYTDNNQ